MSYTNSTTHYALPLPTGSDKSLFTDTNQAFQDIDAAIYSAETVANQAGTDITAIKATIINLQNADVTFQNDITSLKGRMTAVEGVASQNTTDIADVRHDAEDMVTAHNEATATSAAHYDIGDEFIYNDVLYRATAEINIGDTIVPNTNCSATNVMTEVNTINTALSNRVLAEVTADGVKTLAALYAELYGQLSSPSTLNTNLALLAVSGDGSIDRTECVQKTSANAFVFTSTIAGSTSENSTTHTVATSSSDCHWNRITIAQDGTVTPLNRDSLVVTSGNKFRIVIA